ncbi:MAG: hypothetical protein ACRCS8_00385 [Brevinema sp.]
MSEVPKLAWTPLKLGKRQFVQYDKDTVSPNTDRKISVSLKLF